MFNVLYNVDQIIYSILTNLDPNRRLGRLGIEIIKWIKLLRANSHHR